MREDRVTLLNVSGMTCGSCVRHVDRALRALAGVRDVEVRLREGRVQVKHDPSGAPAASMIGALRAAGYEGSVAA